MSDLNQAEARKLFNSIDDMAAMSPASLKIIALSNDPNTEPIDLVNAISMDPTLMAKVLRLVNSAYFGPRNAIVSLNRAVILIGFNTIKNIALSVAVSTSINVRGSFSWFDNEQFWEHSLACALLSKKFALKTGIPAGRVEEYFVSGLLHDIGKVVMIQVFNDICEEIYDPAHQPTIAKPLLEENTFGVTHAKLAGMIAEKWRFPPSLCAAIEHHHTPDDAPEEFRPMAIMVNRADRIVHEQKIGIQTGLCLDTISNEAMASFNLSDEEIGELVSTLPDEVESAKAFLKK